MSVMDEVMAHLSEIDPDNGEVREYNRGLSKMVGTLEYIEAQATRALQEGDYKATLKTIEMNCREAIRAAKR